MPTGTVKWFDLNRGYGFLVADDGSADVFVHARAAEKAGLCTLEPGQRLYYEPTKRKQDSGGRVSAENLRKVSS